MAHINGQVDGRKQFFCCSQTASPQDDTKMKARMIPSVINLAQHWNGERVTLPRVSQASGTSPTSNMNKNNNRKKKTNNKNTAPRPHKAH